MAVFKTPRCTTAQRLELVLEPSEIVYDVDLKEFFGGNGIDKGGFPIGSGGTSGIEVPYIVREITLTAQNIANKYVVLAEAPLISGDIIVSPEGGLIQRYGIDYTIDGLFLRWNNLGLDGYLEAGEILTVQVGQSIAYNIEYITLTTSNIANKKAKLTKKPSSAPSTVITPEGGLQQRFGLDYIIVDDWLIWDGYNLEDFLEEGEVITVQY
jgi:hypothetical protein